MVGSHQHNHDHEEDGLALRVKALEQVLVAKGIVDPKALDAFVETYEHKIGPRNGARVVARAWTDTAYKARLLKDGTAAVAEMGYAGLQGEHLVVVENSNEVHNLITCTLCSCYPWPVLGLPPAWYKSNEYRARSVREPRKVLSEFGLDVPESIELRVWDSNADIRYMVLPQRPSSTEHLHEEALADLVTRNGMIGTAKV
jgi:nitrile hydratase subunit alpha